MSDDDDAFAPTRTAAPRPPQPKRGGTSSSCKQDRRLVDRVVALASQGKSLAEVDLALHREGFVNSAGRPWPRASDGGVLSRILKAAGVPIPLRKLSLIHI